MEIKDCEVNGSITNYGLVSFSGTSVYGSSTTNALIFNNASSTVYILDECTINQNGTSEQCIKNDGELIISGNYITIQNTNSANSSVVISNNTGTTTISR